MTDISRNWYDLSLSSNILKSTYVKGVIDISSNIVGQGYIWINNEKDEGKSSLGIGTNNPVNSINIQANEPCIDFTNSTITEPTNNNQQIGKVDFISPIRGDVTSSSIRCENMGDDYDNNGSLIFGRSNVGYDVVFFSSGNVGIGATNTHQRLHVNGGIEFIMSNNSIGGVHCSGAFGITSNSHLYIKSNTKIVFGSGSTVNTSSDPSFNMNSVSPNKTNMVVTSSGVGINTSAPINALHVNGTMRVTGMLQAKYKSTDSTYSGSAKAIDLDEYSDNWFIGTDGGRKDALWKGVKSLVLTPGIWIMNAEINVAKKWLNEKASTSINTIGIGFGTDTDGTNLARKMYHQRGGHNRFCYTVQRQNTAQYPSAHARLTICKTIIIENTTTIYLGTILGLSYNKSHHHLYAFMSATLLANDIV